MGMFSLLRCSRHIRSSKHNHVLSACFTSETRTLTCGGWPSSHNTSNQTIHQKHLAMYQQVRYFSADTYNNYFSPDVPPIGFAQSVLETTHSVTGLPWWASIALTTFTLRTVMTLPLAVYSMKVIAKVEKLQPEILALSRELKMEVAMAVKKFGWDEKKARREYNKTMKKLIHDLYVRDNCHPLKTTVVLWAQIPIWLCMSFALRNMSGLVPVYGMDSPVLCPDLRTEGALWFSDLTIPDSTWILPVTMGLLNLTNIEMHVLQRQNPARVQRIVTNILRGMILVMVPIGASVPSCMCFYWACSSLFGLGQNVLFKYPSVKRVFGIPRSASDSDTPFQDLLQAARSKYTWRKKS